MRFITRIATVMPETEVTPFRMLRMTAALVEKPASSKSWEP
jgi:hypothetical protein